MFDPFDITPHEDENVVTMYELEQEDNQEDPDLGLADAIDWDVLEEMLAGAAFPTKQDVNEWIATALTAAGISTARHKRDRVLAGLFPEFRDIYDALPNSPRPSSERMAAITSTLTAAQVAVIRTRAAHGAVRGKAAALAREYGVSPGTISDIIHRRTWKEVAA